MSAKWNLTNHVCRVCFGAILSRNDNHGRQRLICADCRTEASGHVKAICACGEKWRNGRDMGHRCQVNPDKSPESPQYIVVTLGHVTDKRANDHGHDKDENHPVKGQFELNMSET